MGPVDTDGVAIFQLGDFNLDSGQVLPVAFLAYKTYGDPRNPVIINPTWYSGCKSINRSHLQKLTCFLMPLLAIHDCAKVFSTSNASLNPSKYFIIVPALFGNGESTSPSNSPKLGEDFPAITFSDNVRAQYRLVTEELGIKHVKAVVGHSMGGAQAYQWAVQYPDFMDVIVPICSSAKTAIHNNIFLEGVKSALIAAHGGTSKGIGKGQRYTSKEPWTPEEREVGLRVFGRVYAGWGFSQTWYRRKLHVGHFGAKDAEDFIVKFFEAWGLTNDPENLLVMLQTWQLGDISASPRFQGNLGEALRSIKARVLLMPSQTDLYFPPEDSHNEVDQMAEGKAILAIIPSIWGHWAGCGTDSKEDWRFMDEQMDRAFSNQ